MPDYQEMYLTMARATEKAIRILTDAQCEAEELYISTSSPDFHLLPPCSTEKPQE